MPAQATRPAAARQKIARFGALPLAIIADSSIDPVSKVVLMFLAAHMGGGGAWPGLGTIAAGIGRDVATVRRHLAELRDRDLLTWQHEQRSGRRMAVFRFTFDRFANLASLPDLEPDQLGQDLEPDQLGQDLEPDQLGQDLEPDQLGQDLARNKTGEAGGDCAPVRGPIREHKTIPPSPPLRGDGKKPGDRIEPGRIRVDREIRELLTSQEGAAGESCDCCRGLITGDDIGLVWSRWGDPLPNLVRIQHVDRYRVELKCYFVHQTCIDVETRRPIVLTVRK
jgi:hypothetical protein